jgi:hypothetical protein
MNGFSNGSVSLPRAATSHQYPGFARANNKTVRHSIECDILSR